MRDVLSVTAGKTPWNIEERFKLFSIERILKQPRMIFLDFSRYHFGIKETCICTSGIRGKLFIGVRRFNHVDQ